MSTSSEACLPRVLIVGGGVAALEAALALRTLAGERLAIELSSPRGELVYRPFAIGKPYGAIRIFRYDLVALTGRIGAGFRRGGIGSVDLAAREATARDGERIAYDHLLIACGARMLWGVPGAVTYWGVSDEGGFGAVVHKLRSGVLRDVVFTMPAGNGWGLPLYELALFAASVLAKSGIEDARLTVVTPEAAPLDLFGPSAARRMTELLDAQGIDLLVGRTPAGFEDGRLTVDPGEPIEAEAAVSLPRLEGRHIEGLPADPDGFLAVDEHCRVGGATNVYAAGDVTGFPVKQSGIATQQADTAGEAIAVAEGGAFDAAPFFPILRGPELDDRLAGRYLAPFLAEDGGGERRILAAG